MTQESQPLVPEILSLISRFFKPRLLTIIVFGIFLSLAGIAYYEGSIRYQFGGDYYPGSFYLWFWLTWPLFPLQLWLGASVPDYSYSSMWITTIAYSYVISCILAYVTRKARGGLKTYYDI